MSHTRPVPAVRAAAVLIAAEALALAVFVGVGLFELDSGRFAVAIGTSLFLLLYAGFQAFAARGLLRLDSWARGPLVAGQLIQLGLAWGLRHSASALAVGMAVFGVAALVCLLAPSTTQQLMDADDAA